jgi:FkbM family methyltransferase
VKKILLSLVSFINRLLPGGVKKRLYHLGPVTRGIRLALNRISPSGYTPVVVSAGGLAGAKLWLDLQSEKDYWLGTYEVDLQQAIRQQLQPGWVVYDVGANIGYISLLLARAVGPQGQVHAFEALPENLERLRHHVGANGLETRVRVNAVAVAAESGPVTFLIGPSGSMGKVSGSAGREGQHRSAIQVESISLDDYIYRLGNPPPQAIKMDIEGGEVLALKGMGRILAEARPLVFLELHGPQAARVAWDTFNQAGYKICRMQPDLPQVTALKDLDWKAYLVAVP